MLELMFRLPLKEMNICQYCRLIHGAKSKQDIDFCYNGAPRDSFQNPRGFTERGNGILYPACRECDPGYGLVYRTILKLEKQGVAETRKEWRTDPVVPGAKDNMRMVAASGNLPSLIPFLEDDPE